MFRTLIAGGLLAALPCFALAATPSEKTATPEKATGLVVELFDGIKAGDIEVKVIPKDSTEGLVTIKNKTDKPLTIKLPAAFAAVPVAAQFGAGLAGGGGVGGGGGGMGGGGNQGMGMGGMGGGMGGMGGGMGGGGGGFFNVAPDKVAKVKCVGVCLDHGKKDPNPRVPYELVPIEAYAKDASVIETVKLMVEGKIDQHSAQAAIWHLQNGLTWEQLAMKIGVKHLNGSTEPYFTPAQLELALAATRVAALRAKDAPKTPARSIGEDLVEQK